MKRYEPTFRRRDLRIAIETVLKAGMRVTGAQIRPDGTIVLETAVDAPVPLAYTGEEGASPDEGDERWERRLQELERAKR